MAEKEKWREVKEVSVLEAHDDNKLLPGTAGSK